MTHDDLRLTLIGGPTVLLEWRGLHLLTDPTFDPPGSAYGQEPLILRKTAGPAVPAASLPPIQGVLLSHDQHADNLDIAGRALLARVPRVVTTPAAAERLGGAAVGLATWGSTELTAPDGTRAQVTGTPARHGPAGIEPISGDVTGFVIRLVSAGSDFPAIYVSGDTVWYEGVAEVARRFPQVGVAVLHLGAARVAARGDFNLTMSAADAISTARAFPSAIIIPVHYQGWAHFSEGRADVVRAFSDAAMDPRVIWLEPGRTSVLQPGTLITSTSS
jgi:L-ascorbate metabolism protein UlaG (beta-lactamase superfamily)